MDLFSGTGNNNNNKIRNKFVSYLKNTINIEDVKVQGNDVIVDYDSFSIIYTIVQNDITYKIE